MRDTFSSLPTRALQWKVRSAVTTYQDAGDLRDEIRHGAPHFIAVDDLVPLYAHRRLSTTQKRPTDESGEWDCQISG